MKRPTMPAGKIEKVYLYIVPIWEKNLDSLFAQIGRITMTLDRHFYSRSSPRTSHIDR